MSWKIKWKVKASCPDFGFAFFLSENEVVESCVLFKFYRSSDRRQTKTGAKVINSNVVRRTIININIIIIIIQVSQAVTQSDHT
jgi:hypothetical protein